MAISFPSYFFYPKKEDGNLSLGTQDARIKAACDIMECVYSIKVDETLCSTKEELKNAIKNGKSSLNDSLSKP